MRRLDPASADPLPIADVPRYARQILLPEVGGEGQRRIAAARILIVGAGGLGSPAALYLAGAGVGTIGLADGDAVDLTNLHRQILHRTADLGRPKTDSASQTLSALNPRIRLSTHGVRLDATNIEPVLENYDVVLDGSDNFETRYLVNDACRRRGKHLVWGAVLRWEGQAMSVPATVDAACYRCVFPEPPDNALALSCADAGILGPVAGVVGSLMAVEALKNVLGRGDGLVNRLWLADMKAMLFREKGCRPRTDCPACEQLPK